MDRQQGRHAVPARDAQFVWRKTNAGHLTTGIPKDYHSSSRRRDTSPAVVDIQGRVVELKEKTRIPSDRMRVRIGGRRGEVTQFSKASRRRLLNYCARVKTDQRPLFITLTYPERYPDVKEAKENHLRAFLERLRRRYPASAAIWRLEFQARGAPHFHILVFGVAFWAKEDVQNAWGSVLGPEYRDAMGRLPFTRVERVKSARGVMAYVSKYIAKMPAAASGFNSAAYSHVGRWWGWFQKNLIPWARQTKISTFHGENDVYWTFKRYLRRYMNGRHIRQGSCTAFVGDAERWRALWHDICMNGHYRP